MDGSCLKTFKIKDQLVSVRRCTVDAEGDGDNDADGDGDGAAASLSRDLKAW